jgi:hypothetical protein
VPERNAVILKFQDVTPKQLERLTGLVDSDQNNINHEDRIVRILKTKPEPKSRPTTFLVEVAVREVTRNPQGLRQQTPRSYLFDILDMVEQFPVEPKLLEQAPTGGPACRECGHPTIPQGGAFQCHNCGSKQF